MRIPIKSMPLISDCGDLESEQENEVFVDTAKSFDEPECLEDEMRIHFTKKHWN